MGEQRRKEVLRMNGVVSPGGAGQVLAYLDIKALANGGISMNHPTDELLTIQMLTEGIRLMVNKLAQKRGDKIQVVPEMPSMVIKPT